MNLLIVSAYPDTRQAFSRLVDSFGFEEVVVSSHERALERFLETGPTHVLVCEYEAGVKTGTFALGKQTWTDITACAMPEQRLLRTGFMECEEPDFIRVPFSQNDLRRALGI